MTVNEIIDSILDRAGFITTKVARENGIERHILSNMSKQGILVRIKNGVYKRPSDIVDEYPVIQSNNDKVIFSYGTALYFNDLSDRTPTVIHLSVPQGYNTSHLKNKFCNLKFHYVKKNVFDLGKILMNSPTGQQIWIYDKERCICDIVKSKNVVDMQIFSQAIKSYFKLKNKNIRKLLKYSKLLGVEKEIRNYIEVI